MVASQAVRPKRQIINYNSNWSMSYHRNLVEPIIVGITLILYILYHLYLFIKYRKCPMNTTFGQNHEIRRIWCHTVIRDRRDILAVQTLRNTLMSSSLLASTSLTLSAVVAAYVVNTIKGEGGIDFLNSEWLSPLYKFFAVILCFAIAFYCYMQSVRASNHAGYLINLPQFHGTRYTPDYAAMVIERGANFHTAGTRMFYLAFLCVIWIFGPIPMVVVSAALIVHLFYLDRAVSGTSSNGLDHAKSSPVTTMGSSGATCDTHFLS